MRAADSVPKAWLLLSVKHFGSSVMPRSKTRCSPTKRIRVSEATLIFQPTIIYEVGFLKHEEIWTFFLSLNIFIDEKSNRAMVDLRTARIKYSNRVASGENFIQINSTEESILMAFESVLEFDRWAMAFQYQQKLMNGGEGSVTPFGQSMLNNSVIQGLESQSTAVGRQQMMMGGGIMGSA